MSITTDFNNMPILDVDYGASNMAGFSGENYFFGRMKNMLIITLTK